MTVSSSLYIINWNYRSISLFWEIRNDMRFTDVIDNISTGGSYFLLDRYSKYPYGDALCRLTPVGAVQLFKSNAWIFKFRKYYQGTGHSDPMGIWKYWSCSHYWILLASHFRFLMIGICDALAEGAAVHFRHIQSEPLAGTWVQPIDGNQEIKCRIVHIMLLDFPYIDKFCRLFAFKPPKTVTTGASATIVPLWFIWVFTIVAWFHILNNLPDTTSVFFVTSYNLVNVRVIAAAEAAKDSTENSTSTKILQGRSGFCLSWVWFGIPV